MLWLVESNPGAGALGSFSQTGRLLLLVREGEGQPTGLARLVTSGLRWHFYSQATEAWGVTEPIRPRAPARDSEVLLSPENWSQS